MTGEWSKLLSRLCCQSLWLRLKASFLKGKLDPSCGQKIYCEKDILLIWIYIITYICKRDYTTCKIQKSFHLKFTLKIQRWLKAKDFKDFQKQLFSKLLINQQVEYAEAKIVIFNL